MIKVTSLFSQILSTIRTAVNFDNLVAKHEAEKNSKGFESKESLNNSPANSLSIL